MKRKLIAALLKEIEYGQGILVSLGDKRYPYNDINFLNDPSKYAAVTRIQTAVTISMACGVAYEIQEAMRKANEES